MRGLIQVDSSRFHDVAGSRFAGSAQNRLHAGYQYLGTEGFGNILIHPQIEALKLILLISFGSEHDDGDLGIIPDFPAYLPAVHLRHHNVQNDQCNVILFKKNIQRLASVSCLHHIVIVFLEEVLYQLAHSAFVIHNQYFCPIHTNLDSAVPDNRPSL